MKSVLCLDLEPRADLPDFRGPHRVPRDVPVTAVKAWREGVPRSAEPFSRIVLSGSTCSITVDNETTEPTVRLVRDAVTRRIPVMGICYGHQMLARALLGPGHVRKADRPEFGWLPIWWNGRGGAWFSGLPNPFRTFVGHFDQVVDLPAGWDVIARSDGCANHAMVNEDLGVVGFQFHPEMDLETGNTCFMLDVPALAAAGFDSAAIVRAAADDNSGDHLFARFLAWRAE